MIARFTMAAAAFGLALVTAPASAQLASGPEPGGAVRAAGAAGQPDTANPATSETAQALMTHGDGVAAIVNDTVISQYDLRQRIGLFLATSSAPATDAAIARIRPQVLQELETERLELLEAEKQNISVSAGEVDKAIDGILSDNHMTSEQLGGILAKNGVHVTTLRAQITAQIAWSKLVQQQYGDRVDVTSEDVNAELARLARGANQPHFLASEIFVPVDTPEQDAKIKKDAETLETQLQMGTPFAAVARQFSQSPTAAQGGDLGWVTQGQLAPELEKTLQGMQAGEVSHPIRSAGGYYILYLRGRQEPAGTKIPAQQPVDSGPAGTLPLERVLLPIGPTPSKELRASAVNAANELRDRITDCAIIPKLAQALKGTVYMNLGDMKLADLSPEIRDALTNVGPGQSTEPFESAAGIEIMVRCDRPAPQVTAFQMPTRPQVEEQLYEDQMSVLARRYMRDLKRDADIETRENDALLR